MRGLKSTRSLALLALAALAGCQLPRETRTTPTSHELTSARQPRYSTITLLAATSEGRSFIARGSAPDRIEETPLASASVVSLDVNALEKMRRPTPTVSEINWVASTSVPRMNKRSAAQSEPAKAAQLTPNLAPASVVPAPAPVVVPAAVPVLVQPRIVADSVVLVGGVEVPVPAGPLPMSASLQPAAKPPAQQSQAPVRTVIPAKARVPAPIPAIPTAPIFHEPPLRLPDQAPVEANTLPPLIQPSKAAPTETAAPAKLPAIPPVTRTTQQALPTPTPIANPPYVGTIEVGGQPVPFATLARMVDGNDSSPLFGSPGTCTSCEGGACGPGQCRAGGGGKCEPFPAVTPVGRFVGLVYQCICCPDPCYQPHWEPIADAAFFTDAPRPVTQTRVRWDYYDHLIFPDRGEYFWARADGSGKGPRPNAPARGTPYLDAHILSVQAEAAAGPASITIITPYRSVNPTPFANSAAGFGDVQINAKNILYDCELFIFSFQMKTYIPSGSFSKGLGVGHMSLEPGLISGIRLSPKTYAVAQVSEWIPLGGDTDYQGAFLRFNFSMNHILWQPVKDVKLIGTCEMNGINFQDGAYTDAVNGPLQKLSGQTAISLGGGLRLFFCDRFDIGIGGLFGASGKYWAREQMRFETRYRF